jgi:hypothetical protein
MTVPLTFAAFRSPVSNSRAALASASQPAIAFFNHAQSAMVAAGSWSDILAFFLVVLVGGFPNSPNINRNGRSGTAVTAETRDVHLNRTGFHGGGFGL